MQRSRTQKITKILTLLIWMVVIEVTVASFQLEKKIQLSSKRAFFSTIQVEDRIFFIGGFERNDFIASKTIDVFNLTSEVWEPPLNLTTPRGWISPAVFGSRIYMIAGVSYTSIPVILDFGTRTFPTVGSTSSPTVRRPLRISLHNTTLTVIGYFSVDFMETTNNQWTHNEELTNIMSQHFDTTTIALRNFVFVMGGSSAATQQPSTSIWVINSTLSSPIEFQNVFPSSTTDFVSSWFDEVHSAAVIHFTNRCFVYHVSNQTWRQRETANNTISSVSFLNSTMVFFSDGYWTINWHSMSETWTPLNQISFAFTIADQLVYCSSNQVSIVTSTTNTTQSINFGTPSLEIAMSSSVHILVNSTGAIFMYYSSTKQLVLRVDVPTFTPLKIFRVNDTLVHIIGFNSTRNVIISVNTQQVVLYSQIGFLPDVMVQNSFFQLSTGQFAPAYDPTSFGFASTYDKAVWTQREDLLYLMIGADGPDIPPYTGTTYSAVDVYNYVTNQWESSFSILPKLSTLGAYIPMGLLGSELFVFPTYNYMFSMNSTGGWTAISYDKQTKPAKLVHPTYTPTVVLNDTAFMQDALSALVIASTTAPIRTNKPDFIQLAASRQLVSTGRQIIMSALVSSYFQNILIYDIATNIWRGTFFQNAKTKMASIVHYDGSVLVFGDELDYITYLNVTTELLAQQPFNNSFVPASLFTLSPSTSTNLTLSNTTLVIAGGYHRVAWTYTDEVQFVTFKLDPITTPVNVIGQPADQPISLSNEPSQNTEDPTIIVAIVVPIGVVVIAGVLLTIFLVRRREQRKKQSTTNISMTGLERQQFGQWFVPFEDIKFGDQLGQGASGQVFKGKWKNTDVALKVSMTQANQSVVSELSVMINLRPHPNVVQLFGFSVHPETNSVILILEFCNGGSLDVALYQSDGAIELSQKLYWLKSICKGISHLHSNNIVHRDIAARNILLHQGEPKITDFGLSRLVDEQQRGTTKSELGPIRWMSPESLGDKQYSTKSGKRCQDDRI
jgi:hypothetical protein